MSSGRSEHRSLVTNLAFLFGAASALLLVCGVAFLYWIVLRHAAEEDDVFFADKIAATRTDLSENGAAALVSEIGKSNRKGRVPYLVRVLDANGQTLSQSPGMSESLPPMIFPAPESTISRPKKLRHSGKLYALASTTAKLGENQYILQIAQDRSGDDRFSRQFAAIVGAVLIVGTIAAAAIARMLARRGLQPVRAITRAVERTGPSHFERIGTARWPQELQPLAAAFDSMLHRLEDSFTRLSQFSADLAHELRTPIANIRGEAEVTLSQPRSSQEYCDALESVSSECERLSGILNNLLFLARAEAAEHVLNRTQFDGAATIQKVADYYRPLAEERQIIITCDGSAIIFADESLFSRALGNLVENSLRFTHAGGKITIHLKRTSEAVQVRVVDSGSGIAADHLSRVFDRFFRGDGSRTGSGSGLGLALVKSIVQLHGGSVSLESETGQGTEVRLTFPQS